MKNFKLLMPILVSLVSLVSFDARALPMLSGTFIMGNSAKAYDKDNNITSNASAAVQIKFANNRFRVTSGGTDDFSALNGAIGTIKDLTFNPFTSSITDFWKVSDGSNTFSFKLNDVVRDASNDPTSFLVLNGTGVISATNTYNDTAANWNYSSDTTGGGIFTWTAKSSAVPEPGVLALLSVGLIGFGLRKKFNNH